MQPISCQKLKNRIVRLLGFCLRGLSGRKRKIGVSLALAPTLQRASSAALRLFSVGFAVSFVNTQRVGPLCLVRVPLFLLLELTNDKPAEERERERESTTVIDMGNWI